MRGSVVRGLSLLAVVACGGGDTDTDDGGGQCGAVTDHTLALDLTVVRSDQSPIEGAAVDLVELAWEPRSVGSGDTDASGKLLLSDLRITAVADCWGTVLDYQLNIVTDDDGEKQTPMNSILRGAIADGETTITREITLD